MLRRSHPRGTEGRRDPYYAGNGQQDPVDRCTSEQTIDGLPPATPAPIPPLAIQEQSGNCVSIPGGE